MSEQYTSPAKHPSYCQECGQIHGDFRAGIASVRAAFAEGRTRAAHRRARVLAHPDIAQALTEPPLNYTSPEMWEGHIPPAWTPTMRAWKASKSAARAALITICEEVARREAEAQEGES